MANLSGAFFLFKEADSATIGQMNLHFKIAFNSALQLFSRLVSAVSILFVTFLITRNLSKDVWGDFVTITSYIGLFTLITDFGLNGAVLRKVINEPQNEEKYYKNLFGLRIILSLFAIFLALAVLAFFDYSSAVKIGIIFGTILLVSQSIFNTAAAAFQLKLRYDLYSISDIIGSLTILFLIFLTIKSGFGLVGVIFVFIIGSVVKALISMFLANSVLRLRGISFDLNLWRGLLVSSLPLGLMLVFSQINANADKQIIALSNYPAIGGITAAVAVGIYGLAYRIFDFAIALPTYIANSAYPILLQNQKENNLALENNSRNISFILFILGGVAAIIGWFLAPIFIGIFGDYSASVLTLRILLLGLPIFFVTAFFVWLSVTLHLEKVLPFIYGFAALENVVLNLVFIPKYGYNAAAWVTFLTEAIIFGLLFVTISTKLNLFRNKEVPNEI